MYWFAAAYIPYRRFAYTFCITWWMAFHVWYTLSFIIIIILYMFLYMYNFYSFILLPFIIHTSLYCCISLHGRYEYPYQNNCIYICINTMGSCTRCNAVTGLRIDNCKHSHIYYLIDRYNNGECIFHSYDNCIVFIQCKQLSDHLAKVAYEKDTWIYTMMFYYVIIVVCSRTSCETAFGWWVILGKYVLIK